MFEVVRYRARGVISFRYAVIPHGAYFSPDCKKDLEVNPLIRRFGPFYSEEEAREFIEELEKE